MLGPTCEPNCPACAAAEADRAKREQASEGVRAIVLDMWLQAIADGERTLNTALKEIDGPLRKLTRFEHGQVLGQFVRRAMELPPAKPRPLRGKPTAWKQANHDLVERIYATEGTLPKSSPEFCNETVFHRAAEIWDAWGIRATEFEVHKWYYTSEK